LTHRLKLNTGSNYETWFNVSQLKANFCIMADQKKTASATNTKTSFHQPKKKLKKNKNWKSPL